MGGTFDSNIPSNTVDHTNQNKLLVPVSTPSHATSNDIVSVTTPSIRGNSIPVAALESASSKAITQTSTTLPATTNETSMPTSTVSNNSDGEVSKATVVNMKVKEDDQEEVSSRAYWYSLKVAEHY